MRGFIVPLLLIILVLALGGGYLLYSKQSLPTITPNFQKEEKMKTYDNESLKFTLQYDKNLKILEETEEDFNSRGNGNFRKNFKSTTGYEPGIFLGSVLILEDDSYDENPFTLWVFDNSGNLSIESWYQNYWYYPFVWGDYTATGKIEQVPTNEVTISGQKGESATIDYKLGKPKFIYVSHDEKMYLFRIIGEKGQKILDTFNFIVNKADEKCVVGGCSNQLCVQVIEGQENQLISTCEYKEEYGCYKSAKCEVQKDGKCGWTETADLNKCLEKAKTAEPLY